MDYNYVYIITNKPRGILYVGVTNDIARRIFEHKQKIIKGFSQKYNLDRLVYVEEFQIPREAIIREKQLKNWHRDWKINLIESINPDWHELEMTH
ncbi:GIY-YIG nuclease family protein [Candidatus Trichorickettsia mobilis]|uniref:GIY-YIG nuclease family protein n=1 Tax=Candidatus Trichorickettsia mobilis TaxID=1346319 RepID=UPI002B25AE95|nr:GIY-YIG nuclease family protein [Candidatus Trichorickettsia mobilis]